MSAACGCCSPVHGRGHGYIKGEQLDMKWADSPRGSNNGTGSLVLGLVVRDGRPGDDFGGDTFDRQD